MAWSVATYLRVCQFLPIMVVFQGKAWFTTTVHYLTTLSHTKEWWRVGVIHSVYQGRPSFIVSRMSHDQKSLCLLIAVLYDSPLTVEVRGLLEVIVKLRHKLFNRLGWFVWKYSVLVPGRSKSVSLVIFLRLAVSCPFYSVPGGDTHRDCSWELWHSGSRQTGRSVVQVSLLMGDNIFSLNVNVQFLVCTVLKLILWQGACCRPVS